MFRGLLQRIEKYLLILLIFLIPSQFALHFWPSWSFVFGIRIDYLSPTIYLTDILIFTLLLIWVFQDLENVSKSVFSNRQKIVWFLFLVIINCYFSTAFYPTIFKWLKFIELIFFALYVSKQKLVKNRFLLKILYFSTLIFSLIGITQFLLGRTIGGVFYWIGERTFTASSSGIALIKFFGRDFLRIYSTFPHPNSLAGFLGGVLILLYFDKFAPNKNYLIYIIQGIALLLTFSQSVYLGFIIVFIVGHLKVNKTQEKIKKVIFYSLVFFSLLSPFVSGYLQSSFKFPKNISERLDLITISGKEILNHFWLGGGLNTFIVNMPTTSPVLINSWLLQPVHNVLLLTMVETGIAGLLVLLFLLHKLIFVNKSVYSLFFLFVVITGFFDHYWFSIQQNLLLIAVVAGLSFSKED